MIVGVEVGVALARPPREDAQIFYAVEVDLPRDPNLIRALRVAQLDAEQLAGVWAASDPRVVMPVRIQTVDIFEV